MSESLGFFTSRYGDLGANLISLGGEIDSYISQNSENFQIFNPVNEFNSTNNLVDYRILYIKNISNKQSNSKNLVLQNPVLTVNKEYEKKLEVLRREDVYRISVNLFVPTYLNVNEQHPKIFSNGIFLDNERYAIGNYIFQNTNDRYYGSRVYLDKIILKSNDYFPIVIQRIISGPVPFIKNFSFSISAKYTSVLE